MGRIQQRAGRESFAPQHDEYLEAIATLRGKGKIYHARVPIDKIKPGTDIDETKVAAIYRRLLASRKFKLDPIVLDSAQGVLKIVDGVHRLEAHRMMDHKEVDAILPMKVFYKYVESIPEQIGGKVISLKRKRTKKAKSG